MRATPSRRPLRLPHALLLLRVAVAALLVTGVVEFVVLPLTGHFQGQFEDFRAYTGAAHLMAQGRSPYADFDAQSIVTMSGFDYPPFAAVLVRPLALLSAHAAMVVWLWISLACTLAGALVLARTSLPATWPRTELALLAAFGFPPATYNYWHGQMNPVVFLLLALAFRSWVRGGQVATGVFLGLAAGIKVAPVVLVLLLLRRRWWRATGAMVAAGLATALVGVAGVGLSATRTFVGTVMPALVRDTGWVYNQSLGGLLSRVADQSVLSRQHDPAPLHYAVLLLGAAMLLGAAWLVRPGTRTADERSAEFGLGVTAMLLAGSITWYPHYTHLLVPIFAGMGVVAARGWHRERTLAWCLGVFLLVVAVAAPPLLDLWTKSTFAHSLLGTRWWWPFMQASSLPCLGTVVLLGGLAYSLHRRRAARPAMVAAAA